MTAPDSSPVSSGSLARSSALMASGTFVSRLLGLLRVSLLAAAIGLVGPGADAWQTANTLPNMVYIMLAGGVLNVIFVPALTRAMARSDGGQEFSDRLITLALAAVLAITVIVTAGAALLTQLYAVTWSGDRLALAIAFAYLCLPQIFCYGLYTVLGQVLNAQERFGWFMWAPVANNVVAIGGIVAFMLRYPEASSLAPGEWSAGMIWLLGGTATLGVLVQALVLIWPLKRSGFRYRPRWGVRGVGLRDVSRLAMWTFAVIGISQLGMWYTTNVLNRASDLQDGAPGKMIYETAFLFFHLPHSIVAISLVTAMFTRLSRAAAAQDLPSLRSQYSHGLRVLGVAMVPISIGMFLLAPALIPVLLPGNDLADARTTAFVAMPLLLALAPYAVYMLSARLFQSFQDGRTTFTMQMVITIVSVVGITIAALLPPDTTAIGIALSQGLGQTCAAVVGLVLVRRRLNGVALGGIARTYLRAAVASLIAAVPVLFAWWLSSALFEGRAVSMAVLVIGGPVFFATYGLVAHRMGVSELSEVAAPVLRRFSGRSRLPLADEQSVSRATAPAATAVADVTAVIGAPDPAAQVTTDQPEPDRKEHALQGIEPGTTLGGRYVLEELLAQRDDDLDYWSARDSTLDRMVAVTVMPSAGEHASVAHAVQDGARRTAGVDDPRLVRVMDMGIDDGVSWIVEEGLAEADSLAWLVTNGPLPAEEARRIIGEAASGLESARRRGLHHLFLSPHAVLRSADGTVKVSGVAVAAAIEQVEDIGSAESSIIDATDLVALLYTALTGYWPGEEMDGLTSARRLADGSLPAPSELVGGVPGDLDALCRQVLAEDYDPRTGPRTPGELAQQLAPWPQDMVSEDVPALDPDDTTERHAPVVLPPAAATESSYFRTEGKDPYPPRSDDVITDLDETQAHDQRYHADADDDRPEPVIMAGSGARPARRRSGAQSAIVLVLILALLGAGIYFVSSVVGGDGEPSADPTQTPTPTSAPTTGGPTTEGPTPTEDPEEEWAVGDSVEIVGITSYDPEGDGNERNDLAAFAIDGDPTTEWRSRRYLAPNWGNLKSGVGLVLDMGESTPVTEVEVTFARGDNGAEVYVNDTPDLDGATEIGADDPVSGTWTVTADEPAEGRYVVVWFTRAWTGPDGERVHVTEIDVRTVE